MFYLDKQRFKKNDMPASSLAKPWSFWQTVILESSPPFLGIGAHLLFPFKKKEDLLWQSFHSIYKYLCSSATAPPLKLVYNSKQKKEGNVL